MKFEMDMMTAIYKSNKSKRKVHNLVVLQYRLFQHLCSEIIKFWQHVTYAVHSYCVIVRIRGKGFNFSCFQTFVRFHSPDTYAHLHRLLNSFHAVFTAHKLTRSGVRISKRCSAFP